MSKPYWSGPGRGGASRFADDPPPAPAYTYDPFEPPTVNFARLGSSPGDRRDQPRYPGHDDPYGGGHDDHDDYGVDRGADHGADEVYEYYRDDRWRWIAGVAAIVLLVALVAIAFASHGGDSATRSATPAPSAPGTTPQQDAVSTTPRTVIATVPPAPAAPPPAADLSPETVVTVTTTPSAEELPPAEPAPVAAPAAPVDQTITYTVTGTRQLFDLVTIIYTDEQGFPRTDINVALPWTRTVVLSPGVTTKSVTATSLTGQLNCTVSDGSGQVLAAQANNAAIATCTP